MRSSSKVNDLLSSEEERLIELKRYSAPDGPLPAAFDLLTRIAANLFHAPISAIAMVDADRLSFKSSQGIEFVDAPRKFSFCSEAILRDDVLIVMDARSDERFADYHLVRCPPHVQFYAGAPLRTPKGYNIGSLSVMDFTPRDFSEVDKRMLKGLSALVVDELDLRLRNLELEEAIDRLRSAEEAAQRAVAQLERAQDDLISERVAEELNNERDVQHLARIAMGLPPSTPTKP